MSRQAIHRLRNILQFVMTNGEPEFLLNMAMGYQRARFDLSLYAEEDRAIIEIEPRLPDQKGSDEAFFLLRAMRARLRSAESRADVAQRTVRHIRSLTNYDRVMLIEFKLDGTGEIVADERRGTAPSQTGFLLRPGDVDMVARGLIREARSGYIPDTAYAPSPILPAPLLKKSTLRNLAAPGLRSFPTPHVEYLRRAGIGATYALPIGAIEAPWGAIVCQSGEPRPIPSEMRHALEFFANGTGMQIMIFGAAKAIGAYETARAARAGVFRDAELRVDPEEGFAGFAAAALRHVPAQGLMLWNGYRAFSTGLAPLAEASARLTDLLERADLPLYVAESAPGLLGRDGLAGVGGFLAVRLAEEPRQYLVFFRELERKRVSWADPLAPSVAVEEEIETGQCAPWSRAEIEAAYALRAELLETVLRRTTKIERERFATLGRQELTIAELHHRVKNLLALFQSLIAKTGETASSLEDFMRTLSGRVRSLALAHDQMSESGQRSLSLRQLVEAELAPFLGQGSTIDIDGDDLGLQSRAFGVAALVIHELATNAAKYGALAREGGRLSIRWSRSADGAVGIDWRERGAGPASQPKRRGFGSTIVERMISYELKGEAELSYSTEGLTAHFRIPAEFVVAAAPVASAPKKAAPRARAIDPQRAKRALVVEDNMIIAIEAEDMLRRLGFADVEVAAGRKDAEQLLDAQPFDVVALDLRLGGETSLPLAEHLADRGIPFIFATGFGENGDIPERFAHIPIVAKPYSDASLAAALSETFGGAEGDESV